jgi:hypothetical protein
MAEFKCSLCDYKSYIKSCVESHIKRKNKCVDTDEIPTVIVINNDKVVCDFCNKSYSTKENLSRHVKYFCKKKGDVSSILLQRIEDLEKRLKDKDEDKHKEVTNITNINNTDNSVNTNIDNRTIIVINSYKDPCLDHLTDEDYERAIKKIFMSVPYFLEKMFLNKKVPENHSILVTNLKDGSYAKVHDGKGWKTIEQEKVINTIVDDSEYILEQHAEDNPELMKCIERYKKIKEAGGKSVEKEIRSGVKTLLYDGKEMVKETINKTKKQKKKS